MLNKVVAPFLRAAPHVQATRRMGHGVPAHWKPQRQIFEENKNHMNHMPVPQGSWQEHYNARNSKWNAQLAVSALVFIGTFSYLWKSGCIYLHSAPPMYNCKK